MRSGAGFIRMKGGHMTMDDVFVTSIFLGQWQLLEICWLNQKISLLCGQNTMLKPVQLKRNITS